MTRTVFLIALCARAILADGGAVVLRQASGNTIVTVFHSPGDMSVLVERDRRPVLDAHASIRLTSPGGRETVVPATHAGAQNKLLYAAPVRMNEAGRWNFQVDITGLASVSGAIDSAAPPPPLSGHWPALALPPLAIALFALNRRLRRRLTC